MSKTWPQVIRDPVHNIIAFEDTDCDRLLFNLINSKEFQRLRRIKQLGLSDMVFPGANHSRFAHSIGVMQNARNFLDRIQRAYGKLADRHRMLVAAAALLHDLGHGPFSHAFENVTGDSHEYRTLEIIRDPSTEIHQILTNADKDLPEHLAWFFDEDIEEDQLEAAAIPAFLTQIVSSQLDADRFDYLLRDCHATGAEYGKFDVQWILQHLRVTEVKKKKGKKQKDSSAATFPEARGRIYLSSKALFAAESYVFARYHMYRTVYFHKTTRAAEVMLRLIFQRFKTLLDDADSQEKRNNVVPGANLALVHAFSTKKIGLQEYLALDDFSVTEFLKCCGKARDKWLKRLGQGLIDRKLYKAVDATEAPSNAVGDFTRAAADVVRKSGFDANLAFVNDSIRDTPYRPYDPDSGQEIMQIYVENSLGELKELSTLVEAVDNLKKMYTLVRYYFPEELREIIDQIAQTTLTRKES